VRGNPSGDTPRSGLLIPIESGRQIHPRFWRCARSIRKFKGCCSYASLSLRELIQSSLGPACFLANTACAIPFGSRNSLSSTSPGWNGFFACADYPKHKCHVRPMIQTWVEVLRTVRGIHQNISRKPFGKCSFVVTRSVMRLRRCVRRTGPSSLTALGEKSRMGPQGPHCQFLAVQRVLCRPCSMHLRPNFPVTWKNFREFVIDAPYSDQMLDAFVTFSANLSYKLRTGDRWRNPVIFSSRQ